MNSNTVFFPLSCACAGTRCISRPVMSNKISINWKIPRKYLKGRLSNLKVPVCIIASVLTVT